MVKVAPEGYPYILIPGVVTAAGFLVGWPAFAGPLVILTLFMLFFFRDPERDIPQGSGLIVSPADGKVIVVRDVTDPDRSGRRTTQVSIFMSPFNVHVNRAPCDGTVTSVHHAKGRFMAAYRDEASLANEHIEMMLETEYGPVLVRQVAGFLARRAVCRKQKGDILKRGERYGIIKFSSRLDICLPGDVTVKVSPGERVKAGESVIGMYQSSPR